MSTGDEAMAIYTEREARLLALMRNPKTPPSVMADQAPGLAAMIEALVKPSSMIDRALEGIGSFKMSLIIQDQATEIAKLRKLARAVVWARYDAGAWEERKEAIGNLEDAVGRPATKDDI